MLVFVPKEAAGESRAALTPGAAEKLVKLGAAVEVEAGLGSGILAADADYAKAGAVAVSDRRAALGRADLVLRIRKPALDEVGLLKKGALHVSLLDPFRETELVAALAEAGTSALSLEM